MAIEILLRKTVESLGRVGQVVRVRPGYARNYLVPFGIAVAPTPENLRLVEKDKAVEAVLEAERAKALAELAERLTAAEPIERREKANPEGHLFGSVGPKQVAEELVARGFPVEEKQVRLENVKQLGEYEVTIHLAPGTEPKIRLRVVDESGGQGAPAPAAKPAKEALGPRSGPLGGRRTFGAPPAARIGAPVGS